VQENIRETCATAPIRSCATLLEVARNASKVQNYLAQSIVGQRRQEGSAAVDWSDYRENHEAFVAQGSFAAGFF